jgi:hypothetical protein
MKRNWWRVKNQREFFRREINEMFQNFDEVRKRKSVMSNT